MNRKTFLLYTGYLVGLPAMLGHTSCKHEIPDPPFQPVPPAQWLMEVKLGTFLLNVNDYVQDTVRGIHVKRIAPGNDPASFLCFSLACTHSGCMVVLQGNAEFHCPCHGSKFNADGSVINGPAARPLDRFKILVDGNTLRVTR
jgi:Rieske Fe-S protein